VLLLLLLLLITILASSPRRHPRLLQLMKALHTWVLGVTCEP
jgi:hypothetical protein